MRGRTSTDLSPDGTGELEDVQSNVQQRLHKRENKVGETRVSRRNESRPICSEGSELRRRYLAEVGVKVHHAVAELLHVLCQELVCVGYPVIQVSHFVVGEAPEAERVVSRGEEDGGTGRRERTRASLRRARAAPLTASIRRTASL